MRRISILVSILVALVSLSGCGESYQWNQRVTVTIETPAGLANGSSVNKVSWRKNDSIGSINGAAWVYGPRGEAVVLTLGEGRHLFALVMKDEYAGNIAGQILFKQDGRVWGADKFKAIQAHKGVLEVPFSRAPLLVTFDDTNDPKTVRLVDPNDLDAAFGLCPDGSGLKDADAPWRAEGMSWLDWRNVEAWKSSRAKAGAVANLLTDTDSALVEFDELAPQFQVYGMPYMPAFDIKITEAKRDRIISLQKKFTYKERSAWEDARYQLIKELTAAWARDNSNDCYQLKPITLEITDENVTEGEVEKVLGWLPTLKENLRPVSLRLGKGLHAANKVLPEENIGPWEFKRPIKYPKNQ